MRRWVLGAALVVAVGVVWIIGDHQIQQWLGIKPLAQDQIDWMEQSKIAPWHHRYRWWCLGISAGGDTCYAVMRGTQGKWQMQAVPPGWDPGTQYRLRPCVEDETERAREWISTAIKEGMRWKR